MSSHPNHRRSMRIPANVARISRAASTALVGAGCFTFFAPSLPPVGQGRPALPPRRPEREYVWHIRSPKSPASPLVSAAAAALTEPKKPVHTQTTAGLIRPSGRCRLLVVGPERRPDAVALAKRLKGVGLPILGLGDGGLDILSRMNGHFTAGETEAAANALCDLRALRSVFAPHPMPDWAQGGASVPVPLYSSAQPVVWTLGIRLVDLRLAPLVESEAADPALVRACAGWTGNLAFWGVMGSDTSAEARQIYRALVRKIGART